MGPLQFLNSSLYWSSGKIQSSFSFDQVKQFILAKENDDWIVPEDQYNEEFKNWRGTIHNVQFRSQTLKEKRKIEKTCSKYAGSTKLKGIPREGKPEIPIKSYKDQCREHIIRNGMWDVFSLTDPYNKEKI